MANFIPIMTYYRQNFQTVDPTQRVLPAVKPPSTTFQFIFHIT